MIYPRTLAAFFGLSILTMGLVFLSAPATHSEPAAKPASSFSLDKRVPLTTSRVVGSPDPPLPYRAVRAFERLSFQNPVYFLREPGSRRILVVEWKGKILAFPGDPKADKTEVYCQSPDHDFYSLTFHPQFANNDFVYVFSNGPNHPDEKKRYNRIWRYTVNRQPPRRCDPRSAKLIIEWASNGHNGGDLAFGPDGMLYITSGDGTSDSDGDITGQKISDLTSGMVRINVDRPDPGKNYSVPKDNPFLHIKDARPELWAYGFRNPWRMTFDPKTGDLWVGDVGQDLWEMIHLVTRAYNPGWSVYEGGHPFQLQRQRGPTPISTPIMVHPHSESRSITGGIVYYGSRFKDLQGAYVYGDYATGKIWGLRQANGKITWQRELADTPHQIVGFGQDHAGELNYVDHAGQLYALEPAPPEPNQVDFPRKLSQTGLFASVPEHRPQPALIPYSVNSPLWSDGADKERFIALPGLTQIDYADDGFWKFPEQTVLVKTFSLPPAEKPGTPRRLETRLLHFQQGEWVGYSYLWNDEQTDADLVGAGGIERTYSVADSKAADGKRQQTWHYPSRAECMVCHSRAANYVLGLNTMQMNRVHDYGGVSRNQLRALEGLDVLRVPAADRVQAMEVRLAVLGQVIALETGGPFGPISTGLMKPLQKHWEGLKKPLLPESAYQSAFMTKLRRPVQDLGRLTDPYDGKADLDARARSYLHANCAQCHVAAGGGNSAIDLALKTPKMDMKAWDVKPLHDAFGIRDARILAAGKPEQSVLLQRVARRGPGQMPPLATSVVDERAVRLLQEWIRSAR